MRDVAIYGWIVLVFGCLILLAIKIDKADRRIEQLERSAFFPPE